MGGFNKLTQRIRDRIDQISMMGPLSRHDARLWREVESLEDIGELTARWLEGYIETHPGYYGRPDPETDELVPYLADMNRSGYVTTGSQPGLGPVRGYDGNWWWQRAAVDGFARAETADRIGESSTDSGLAVVRHDRAGWRTSWNDVVDVTRSGPDETPQPAEDRSWVHTSFGTHLSHRAIRDELFGDTPAPSLVDDVPQVTVADPQWGRNDLLWPTLIDALHRSREKDEREASLEPPERERIEIPPRELNSDRERAS